MTSNFINKLLYDENDPLIDKDSNRIEFEGIYSLDQREYFIPYLNQSLRGQSEQKMKETLENVINDIFLMTSEEHPEIMIGINIDKIIYQNKENLLSYYEERGCV